MARKQTPLTASIRIISEDVAALQLVLDLLDTVPGVTPLRTDTSAKRGRDGKGWITYHEIMISDAAALEKTIESFMSEDTGE